MKCPNCKATKRQVKNGLNPSGSQKYQCQECKTIYTPEPKRNGYPAETRLLAIRMYVEDNSYNAIGRILKVNPQSVVNCYSRKNTVYSLHYYLSQQRTVL